MALVKRSAKWYAAIRKANSKPRTVEHCRKLALAHKGTKATRATRKRMSAAHRKRLSRLKKGQCRMCGSQTHTYKQHHERLRKGRINSRLWRKKVVEVNRALKSGTKCSLTTRRKMSRSQVKVQARLQKCGGKQRFLYVGDYETVWMRSSWEVAFANKLDCWEILWEYEPKSFFVGKGRWKGIMYLPDFYLPDFGVYIEIKGWLRRDACRKLREFRRRYPKVNWFMLQAHDLKAIGALPCSKALNSGKRAFLALAGSVA